VLGGLFKATDSGEAWRDLPVVDVDSQGNEVPRKAGST
jgi:hypothetical protein